MRNKPVRSTVWQDAQEEWKMGDRQRFILLLLDAMMREEKENIFMAKFLYQMWKKTDRWSAMQLYTDTAAST